MVAYAPEPEGGGTRRQVTLAAVLMVVALSVQYLSEPAQQQISLFFRSTLLRPFIATQEMLAGSRLRAGQLEVLQAELDSLTARVSSQAGLAEENETLRGLLRLGDRVGPTYLPASVLRPGTPGSESMFLVDVGYEDGVGMYAPVVAADGLVGVVREVQARNAVGMDWTHPDFRVSAMLEDGSVYGMVENVRGDFREEDRLMLNGTAYHETVRVGTRVVTSGLGGVFPRGIPIGVIAGTAEEEGAWRKSYWLEPLVQPGSATHVLVATETVSGDVSEEWYREPASQDDDGPGVDADADSSGASGR